MMFEKRRDKKGRILRMGESQRKDGRYRYKYMDAFGREQSVYSWRLVSTDKVPKGKRFCLSLREKEAQIQNDRVDGIDKKGAKMTLCQLYEKQNASRSNVKKSTVKCRRTLMNILQKDKLGARSIDALKISDVKEWVLRMKNNGYSYQTISNHKRSLSAAFHMAIQDDYIRKNPFDFNIGDVLEDDRKTREPLTEKQEDMLLTFLKNDKVYGKYYDAVVLLLRTGIRISELCGLTVQDVDFKNRLIDVNHQLLRNKEDGYYIDAPKTKSGKRKVPISDEAFTALKHAIAVRNHAKPLTIGGYSDFIFLNQKGYPMTGALYASIMKKMVKKYNKIHENKLPPISPHLLRHTFCTRLASRNMNPKSLQYIMGHSNINITLNLYVHASIELIKEELKNLVS